MTVASRTEFSDGFDQRLVVARSWLAGGDQRIVVGGARHAEVVSVIDDGDRSSMAPGEPRALESGEQPRVPISHLVRNQFHFQARQEIADAALEAPRVPSQTLSAVPTWLTPLIVIPDTNSLARACVASAVANAPSPRLTNLLATGRVAMLLPTQVPDEMPRAIARVIADRRQPELPVRVPSPGELFAVASGVWREQIAPLTPVVDLPVGELLRPEIQTVARGGLTAGVDDMHSSRRIRGDCDDMPTAALAAFIGDAVIWSGDTLFLSTGLSTDAPQTAGDTVEAAIAELALVNYLDAMGSTLNLAGATVSSLYRLATRYPAAALAVAGGILVAGRGERVVTTFKRAARGTGAVAVVMAEVTAELLAAAQGTSGHISRVTTPGWRRRTVVEMCAVTLARSPGPMSATNLLNALRTAGAACEDTIPTAVGDLSAQLRAHPAFTWVSSTRRWQLGRYLVP